MKINKIGLALIKHFEGLRLKSYLCPAGVWTIGYGSTGKDIVKGLEWTKQQAEDRLKKDVALFEAGVRALVKVDINENQFSALVCFAYNLGLAALKNSTLLSKVNSGKDPTSEFGRWVKASGKTLPGLVRRRAAEASLYAGDVAQLAAYV